MDSAALRELLTAIHDRRVTVDAALDRLRRWPAEDLSFAQIDHHRQLRCGFPEAIYCESKTPAQVVDIFRRLAEAGGNVLATRAAPEVWAAVRGAGFPDARYNEAGRCIVLRRTSPSRSSRRAVSLVTAGTADIPVAEEVLETAQIMDQRVQKIYDVGVAGIHRVLSRAAELRAASVVVVVAGMEGALASVVGGLVDRPVIAVPTSVGYGASFGGLAPLLTMLNSCASNVLVVNIDNGFGAGCAAALINRLAEESSAED
jgi:NCAIR mutase (PurE)-related protein